MAAPRNSSKVRLQVERLEDRLTPANNPALRPPVLNSLPTATAKLYLDFTGHRDANWLGYTNVDTPPYDRDGDPNSFNDVEMAEMTTIWRYVAEDYLPFNINVTTVQPANFLKKNAMRVAIGGDGAWYPFPAGGVAQLNTFGAGAGTVSTTAFVFSNQTTDLKYLGDAVSHEAGHSFGLYHQSEWTGSTKIAEYYLGPGDDTAPTMGGSALDPAVRGLWWYGTNSISQTTFQDDIAVLANKTNNFGLRFDDYGNTRFRAKFLDIVGRTSNNFKVSGLINTMTDVDFFSFQARQGPINLNIKVPAPYNNLDAKAQLYDQNGNLLQESDLATTYNAAINYTARYNGTYYLAISSHGISSAGKAGTNFGQDVGTYVVTGTILPYITSLSIKAPVRWIYDARRGVHYGYVSVVSNRTISGAYSLTFTLPHSSVQVISPNATRTGNNVKFRFSNGLTANVASQFLIQVKNPLRANLGTFHNSFLTRYLLE